MKAVRFLITLSLLSLLCSCSPTSRRQQRFERKEAIRHEVTQGSTPVIVEELDSPNTPQMTDVEILWLPPEEQVDGFVISYGYDREDLSDSVKISFSDAELIEDPVHGKVFHYIIHDVPLSRKLYLTVSAYKGDEILLPGKTLSTEP